MLPQVQSSRISPHCTAHQQASCKTTQARLASLEVLCSVTCNEASISPADKVGSRSRNIPHYLPFSAAAISPFSGSIHQSTIEVNTSTRLGSFPQRHVQFNAPPHVHPTPATIRPLRLPRTLPLRLRSRLPIRALRNPLRALPISQPRRPNPTRPLLLLHPQIQRSHRRERVPRMACKAAGRETSEFRGTCKSAGAGKRGDEGFCADAGGNAFETRECGCAEV